MVQNYVYSFKYLRNIISLFLYACVGASSYFLNVLLLLAMFDRVFCKDFPGESFSNFYNQIKCKRGKNFHLPAENNKPIEILQTKKNLKDCSAFGRLKFLGGFQTLVMTESLQDHLCLTWLYIACNITYIIWMKGLLRNKLNDFCLGSLSIFGF